MSFRIRGDVVNSTRTKRSGENTQFFFARVRKEIRVGKSTTQKTEAWDGYLQLRCTYRVKEGERERWNDQPL